jgi:hypothetical protein
VLLRAETTRCDAKPASAPRPFQQTGARDVFAPHPCSYPRLLIIDFAICPIAAPRLASFSHRRPSAARSLFSIQKRAITDPPGDRQRRDHSRYIRGWADLLKKAKGERENSMTFERYPGTGAWTSDRARLTSVASARKGRRVPLHQYPSKPPSQLFVMICWFKQSQTFSHKAETAC